jgi:thiol-disulfide isomerase/thioredoxin
MSFLPPITDLDHDTNKANMKVFKDHVAAGKPAFLFLYLDFCGPCNMTKESWKDIHKFTNAEQLKKNDVIVAQINQSLFKEMENIGAEPNSFPTIRYIGKNGKIIEEYESARTPEAFAQWIESKIVKESSKSHHKKRVHHKKSMKG